MKRTLTTCGIAVALVGSAMADEPSSSMPPPSQHGLACEPRQLHRGDTLNITFPNNHGADFAIVDPMGRYFFIAFQQPDPASKLQPIIAASTFLSMKSIGLEVNEARGVEWRQGNTEKQPIFQRDGIYRVLLSGALETEDPVLDGWCYVNFRRGAM